MKFQPITTKNIVIWLASGAIIGAIGLWSASLTFERTVGKRVTANGVPVVVTIDRPNKNRLLFLSIAGGLIGAAALATLVVDDKGDRLLCPETLVDDIGEANKVLANNIGCALLFVSGKGFRWAFGKQSIARQITLSVMPVEIRDRLTEKITDGNWFRQFLAERKHYIICGGTGDGKTMVLLAIIYDFLKSAQERMGSFGLKDKLMICDSNYGKRDENGNLNTWMDLPLSIVKTDVNQIMGGLRSAYDELMERQNLDLRSGAAKVNGNQAEHEQLESVFKERGKLFIVIEEFMATRRAISLVDSDLLKEFDNIIANILLFGRGYGVKLLIVLQYLNASKGMEGNGLNLGERDQACTIALKSVAISSKQLEKIAPENAKELSVEFAEALKKHQYCAVVQFGGGTPKIRKIPDLSWVSGVSVKSQSNSVDVWWSQVWTEANQQWAIDLIEQGRSPTSSAFDSEIKTRFGIGRNAKDPRYQKYKAAIEQIKSKQKQLVGV